MQHPARGNRWATGAERVKGSGNMLELRVPIGLLSSFLTSLKGEGFPRQPRPSTGQCETQDTIPFLSRLLLVRAVHLRWNGVRRTTPNVTPAAMPRRSRTACASVALTRWV